MDGLPPGLQDSYARDFRLADEAFRAGRMAATFIARETRWKNWTTYLAGRDVIGGVGRHLVFQVKSYNLIFGVFCTIVYVGRRCFWIRNGMVRAFVFVQFSSDSNKTWMVHSSCRCGRHGVIARGRRYSVLAEHCHFLWMSFNEAVTGELELLGLSWEAE